MRSKLLRVKIDRFQRGRPLASEVFLEMPINQKMIRIVAAGDDIRTKFLERLPGKGVTALYIPPVQGEEHSPDTIPLYVERAELENDPVKREQLIKEEVQKRFFPEIVAEEEAPAEESSDHWEEEAKIFAKVQNPQELHHFNDEKPQPEPLTLVEGGAPSEAKNEDNFFSLSAVEEVLNSRNSNAEKAEEAELRKKVILPPPVVQTKDGTELGANLVQVTRHFAVGGEHYNSPQLKSIAGDLAKAAQIFFNQAPSGSVGRVARVLHELKKVRKELRILSLHDGYTNFEQLTLSLDRAIESFQRGMLKA